MTGRPVPRESLKAGGWALFLHGTVSHVEILIDGQPVGRARLGLPRLKVRDTPAAGGHPAAAVSGFEWIPGPGDLPTDRDRVRIEARVTSTEGETFELSLPEEVRLEPPEAPFDDRDAYALELRRRSERFVRARVSRPGRDLNVLAFTHRLDHGGAQRYFFEQIRYLLRDPHVSCTVIAPEDGVWRRRLETIGAEVHLTGYPATGVLEYESAVAQLAAWASARDFDVAFANTLDTFLGADLAARLGIPLAWSIHESFSLPSWWLAAHGRDGHPYVRGRIDHALSRASALIFAADATRRLFEPYSDASRMVTAPYGLELGDIDAFRHGFDPAQAQRRRARFPDGARLVLCLGTVNARKAQAVLAQAFAEVADAHPSAHLVLVGDTGGDYSQGIRTYAADAGLESHCTLVPVTSDPYSWHEVADVFVLSSDIESSPISILEAMAFETPVVASRVFGVPELIEEGRHGYLCEPSHVGDLARSLDRVLRADPAELRRIAVSGAERVRSRHDPLRYARSLRRLLLDLAADPAVAPSWEPEPVPAPGDGRATRAENGSPRPAAGPPGHSFTAPAANGSGGLDPRGKPRPTVRDDLRDLIREAARAERGAVDAATVDSLLGYGPSPDSSSSDRIACLERVDLTGASVLEVGSSLGELSRTARALGAEVVDGVQPGRALVTLAGLINAYRGASRISFHADLEEIAARGERYDVAIVSLSTTVEEVGRAVELAERAVVLELTSGGADPSLLAEALAPGFPALARLGEVESFGEPSTVILLARADAALSELLTEDAATVRVSAEVADA